MEPDLAATPCPQCGGQGLRMEGRMHARPIGSFSLAGHQMKYSVHMDWPTLVHDACGLVVPADDPYATDPPPYNGRGL